MSLSFNKVQITNTEYGQEIAKGGTGEMLCGGRFVTVELDVLTQPVYMQTLTSITGESGQALWDQELYLSPQHRTISRQGIFGIRFRRDPLSPPEEFAFVTVQFIGENEAWPNLNQLTGR